MKMQETILIKETNFEKARKLIKENASKRIIFCGDDETNRKILEKENINILLLKQQGRKDSLKQRNSGFNQVLAKLAKKKGIVIGIDLDEIKNSEKIEKSEVIARIKQNIKLCNKDGLEMEFFSGTKQIDKKEVQGLGLALGMPTWMIKQKE